MALAFTSGLKVKALTRVRKIRKLPITGDVLVGIGDNVSFDTVVARTSIPGNVQVVKVCNIIDVEPEDIETYMRKKEGESVKENELISYRSSFFGLSKGFCQSPCTGTIERISNVTGHVAIRELPIPVEVQAYISGKVTQIFPGTGVQVEAIATFIQGIFGIGGETHGELTMVADSPSDVLTADKIGSESAGKILVAGSLVTCDALHKAVKMGAKGIIVGGLTDKNLTDFLGYRIGVAVTGDEEVKLTLIVTEGFGKVTMSKRTFELLENSAGKVAAINGATQIRAGVIRPEVIVPIPEKGISDLKDEEGDKVFSKGLDLGMKVRVIRKPYFGALGHVVRLPPEHQLIETESHVRVLEVELEDGRKVIVPRANVEIIEE